jgi:hypothetical protein
VSVEESARSALQIAVQATGIIEGAESIISPKIELPRLTEQFVKCCQSLLIAAVFLVTIFNAEVSAGKSSGDAGNCREWNAKVDPRVKGKIAVNAANLSEGELMTAIGCLLKNQGNREIARIGGATKDIVSQMFPRATVELASLYCISYLFTGNYQHGEGVALWNDHGVINPPGGIESAYKAYAAWFDRVKSMGIAEARKQRLDPLEGTNVRWYGN